jgi:hypothetical protein
MITQHYTTPFEITRNQWVKVTIGDKEIDQTAEVVVGSFNGHLQQATAEYAQYNGLSLSKGYTVWCPLTTKVGEGDTITTNGIQYLVRARKELLVGDNQHLQLAIELIGKEKDGS